MDVVEGAILTEQIVLERELGRGGMGVVWLARHRGLEASVAVKVLHAEAAGSEEARARFDREAKAVARIDSPHVVRIFDVGVTEKGQPFIVMELLRGRDLKAHLGEEGPLGLEDAVSMVSQLCAALGRAHELGIIHRDIKPANVFLADGGAGIFVKLLDFGIARIASAGGLQLTATESLVGTPYYMSPEQFIDARKIDPRSDLWSVAVVAYASLTNALPFLGESVGALALEVHRGDFMAPTVHCSGLPASLDDWFKRALDPEPGRRFQTAAELAQTFAAAVRGTAPVASPSQPAKASVAPQATSGPTIPLAASPSFAASTEVTPAPPASRRITMALLVAALLATGAIAAALAISRSREIEPVSSTAPTAASLDQPSAPAVASSAAESSVVATAAPIAASASAPGTATLPNAGGPTTAALPIAVGAASTSASSSAPPAAAAGPPPGYRPRKQVCNKGQGFCNNCCQPGDLLGTYPDCQCYWKPAATGVPAGARRTGSRCNPGTDFCHSCCPKGDFMSDFPDCACYRKLP